MADHLEIIAEEMDRWISVAQRRVNQIKTDEDYYRAATELLDITGAFIVLLHSFGDALDEQSVNVCIYRAITCISLVRFHTHSRKVFETASEEVRRNRAAEIQIMRNKSLDDVLYIVKSHDLPNIY